MKKSMFLRTDVLPEELPLLFSNKNLHLPFTKKMIEDNFEILSKLYEINTVPYYFNIPKDKTTFRKISLLHPIAQLQAYLFIMKYERMITEFCSSSKFSARSPVKLNSVIFNKVKAVNKKAERLNEEFSFSKDITITSEEDQALFYNYFSYKPFKNIKDLLYSPKFNRAKYRYDYFIKLDIQNFFPSIYSHSLAWAVFGDKALAKQNKNANLFPNAIDKITSKINFQETNGLIVGPEFARVIAEVLLTRVDTTLYQKLKQLELYLNKDYVIYRYIDDIFIFTKKEDTAVRIEEELSNILDIYNLTLNNSKREIQSRPFKIYNKSIISLNRFLSEFNANNMYEHLQNKENLINFIDSEADVKKISIPAYPHNWSTLFRQIEQLIYENEEDSRKVVNYFLKAIRGHVNIDGHSPWVIRKTIEIITSVFALDINYKSTYTLLSNYIKILLQIKELTLENNDKNIDRIDIIQESIFQNGYSLLKNNFSKIGAMHELIIFMKQLPKTINSQFLCKVIINYPKDYFVLCSVGYYILNEELNSIDKRYITVKNLLENTIVSYSESYSSKGSKHNAFEGEFFYLFNDFSHYPGFDQSTRNDLKLKIGSINNNFLPQQLKIVDNLTKQKLNDVWNYMTKHSYFQWNKTNEDFSKKIVKKIINYSDTSDDGY